ncbi:hypothetical protein BDR03DRAFT_966020 [Suillus americanus]|nr:hypothetical protein BDR03DRAFT_966020 [Suillus americanus]
MKRTDGNETNRSAQSAQPAAAGIQGPEGRRTETSGRTGEVSCEVSCCGFFFGHRRSTPRQS